MAETHLTVPATSPRAQYVADGYQVQFPFPFPVLKNDDLDVFVGEALVTAGYAISGLGVADGGTVSFSAPPAAGARVTLRRRVSIARTTDFQEGGAFRAKVINDELDFQTMALQELAGEVGRAARLAPTAPDDLDVTLPPAVPGKAIGWSEDGLRLVNDPSDFTATVATVQQWAANADGALDQASDAAAAAASSAAAAGTARSAAADHASVAETARDDASAAASSATEAAAGAIGARAEAEAFAVSAAFDAFRLRADRATALAAASDATAAAVGIAATAAQAVARLEDVDLSLWRADRAAHRAEAAALRAEAMPLTHPPAGITPGALLPNWARIDT